VEVFKRSWVFMVRARGFGAGVSRMRTLSQIVQLTFDDLGIRDKYQAVRLR